jgi:hypothetical protein
MAIDRYYSAQIGAVAQVQSAKLAQQASLAATAEQKREYDLKYSSWKDVFAQEKEQYSSITNMLNEYQKQYATAVASNLQKYQEELATVRGVSGQAAADIRSSYAAKESSMQQNLARLGMSGTTIGASLSTGLERSKSAALTTQRDTDLKTQLAVMQGYNYTPSVDASVLQTALSVLKPTYSTL